MQDQDGENSMWAHFNFLDATVMLLPSLLLEGRASRLHCKLSYGFTTIKITILSFNSFSPPLLR